MPKANEGHWSITQIYVVGSIILALFLPLLCATVRNLAKEWNTQKRKQLLCIHGLLTFMFICRMLQVLLGFYGTETFFAARFGIRERVSDLIKSVSCAALLCACSLELSVFLQLGWAATLRLEELARVRRMKTALAHVGAIALITLEVLPHLLELGESQSLVYAQIAIFCLEILVAFGMILGLCSTLLDLDRYSLRFKSVRTAAASWSMPSDDHTMSQNNTNVPPSKPAPSVKFVFLKRLLVGLRLLPKRAQLACIAVGIGFMFIATQTMSELLYQVIEFNESLAADRVVQSVETVLFGFQAAAGFAISHSTRVLTLGSQKSMNFLDRSKK